MRDTVDYNIIIITLTIILLTVNRYETCVDCFWATSLNYASSNIYICFVNHEYWYTFFLECDYNGWQIAELAEFFSFGTNDLTQMTFGYSRDDVGKFLPTYLSQGILQHDPFEARFSP
jgi:hypothetical protein